MSPRDEIARIIDPEGVNNYEDACRRQDGVDRIIWFGRLNAAREKADRIAALLDVPIPAALLE